MANKEGKIRARNSQNYYFCEFTEKGKLKFTFPNRFSLFFNFQISP